MDKITFRIRGRSSSGSQTAVSPSSDMESPQTLRQPGPDRSPQCHSFGQAFVFLFHGDGSPLPRSLAVSSRIQYRSRIPPAGFSIYLQPLKRPFPFVQDHHSHASSRNQSPAIPSLNLDFLALQFSDTRRQPVLPRSPPTASLRPPYAVHFLTRPARMP